MTAITKEHLRQLAAFEGNGHPVTSCYLNVDGSRHTRRRDVVDQLSHLVREGRAKADGRGSVIEDLRLIEEYVKGGIDRSRIRGLAFFSSSASRFWKVVELPVPVQNQLVVNLSPAIRQLEAILDEYEPFAVLLADRQHARLVVFDLGEIVEVRELFEQLPRGGEDVTRGLDRDGRGQARNHLDELAHQHLRHAAQVAFDVLSDRSFGRLIISATDEVACELEALLHPYLRDRLEARCNLAVNASLDEIRTAALVVEAGVERRKEAELVDRLRDAAGSGNRGVAGLVPTLEALAQRRVDTLVISENLTVPGWRCGACRTVATVGRVCELCGAEMHQVDDVVEEAIEEAQLQSCQVEICTENADLDVLGGIGALLRY